MVSKLAVVLLVGGCGFSAAPQGGASDASIDGPDGPIALPDDQDGDGIADASDNCPTVANPNQENEDADDRGDACDLCPHLPGTVPGTDADDDGDGVGNQCDPRVGTDRRVLFLGFNDVHDLDAFALRAGSLANWSISGGQLHANDTSADTPQQIVWTTEAIHGSVVVDATVHIGTVNTAGVNARLVAIAGGYYDGTTVDAYACGLRGTAANDPATITAWHYVNPPSIGSSSSSSTTGNISTGKSAHLHLQALDQNPNSALDCLADASPATLDVSGYVPDGYPGLRTLNMTATFDYLFVVAIGP